MKLYSKILAWLVITLSCIVIIYGSFIVISVLAKPGDGDVMLAGLYSFLFVLLCIPPFIASKAWLRKKKWGWIVTFFLLLLYYIVFIFISNNNSFEKIIETIIHIVVVTILILMLLDKPSKWTSVKKP